MPAPSEAFASRVILPIPPSDVRSPRGPCSARRRAALPLHVSRSRLASWSYGPVGRGIVAVVVIPIPSARSGADPESELGSLPFRRLRPPGAAEPPLRSGGCSPRASARVLLVPSPSPAASAAIRAAFPPSIQRERSIDPSSSSSSSSSDFPSPSARFGPARIQACSSTGGAGRGSRVAPRSGDDECR